MEKPFGDAELLAVAPTIDARIERLKRDVATGDVVHADGKAIAEKVRPFLNAGVCVYLKAKKKVMLAQKRKASQAFARDVVREIERKLRARQG